MDWLMSLPQVQVKPNPDFSNKIWPIGPKHVDLYKESYRNIENLLHYGLLLMKNAMANFALDRLPEIKPLSHGKYLLFTARNLICNPDCDLNLHKNQKITGGSHGWRHMQFQASGHERSASQPSLSAHI